MKPRPLLLAAAFAFLCTLLSAAPAWRPIPAEDLAAGPPANDPDANGLTLLREIFINAGDLRSTEFEYYYRAKVFTPAGIDVLNKTEIPFEQNVPPRDLAARVVKANGQIIDVAPSAIYTREVVRGEGESIWVKAFAYPALEPGDIVEYRYRIHERELILGMRFYFDDAFPTALARLRIGKVVYPGLRMRTVWSADAPFSGPVDAGGDERFYEARGIPSTTEESFAPPEDMAKPWFLYYYSFDKGTAQDYWSHVADEILQLTDDYLAPKKRIKETVAQLLADSPGEEEAIRRLYEFCRTKLKNTSHPGSGYTSEQIEKLKPNKSSVDILTNGHGTAAEINMLFGALLRASGRTCHLALCGDRSRSFFNQDLKTRSALPHLIVAVYSNKWTYYDPGALYLPPGCLNWKHELTTALIATPPHAGAMNASKQINVSRNADAGKRQWQFVEIPKSPASYSTTRRTAVFDLATDGTLEGRIDISLSGHAGFALRQRYIPKSNAERRSLAAEDLRDRLGQVEVLDCSVDLHEDFSAPPSISCRIRITDYATPLGDRLLLPLAFFQKGLPDPLAATERRTNVYFHYDVSEKDKVSITLPEGFKLEPPGFFEEVGDGDKFHCSHQITLEDNGRRILYERGFARRILLLSAADYPIIRDLYQKVFQQDARTFSFLRATAATDAAP